MFKKRTLQLRNSLSSFLWPSAFCVFFLFSASVSFASMSEQAKRHTIIEMHRAGHSPPVIHKIMKYPKSTILSVIKRYKNNGQTTRKRGKDRKTRKDNILTPKFLAKLKRSIDSDPSVNQSVHAKKMKVCEKSITNAVRKLGMKSRAMTLKHLITGKQREQRLIKSKRILNSLKNEGRPGGAKKLKFVSDEKIFTGMLNPWFHCQVW